MAFIRNFRVHHAEGGQVGGFVCAANDSAPPRNSLISLNLQKIAHFWNVNGSVLLKNRKGIIIIYLTGTRRSNYHDAGLSLPAPISASATIEERKCT
jgi:hypothetical protein